jgi:hypothetical protein
MINRVKDKKISISTHAMTRMHERGIFIDEVLNAIIYGEIIEEYTDDYPYPSCLILGYVNKKVIHIVCSDSDPVYIVTAYEPNLNKWYDDYKTRRL